MCGGKAIIKEKLVTAHYLYKQVQYSRGSGVQEWDLVLFVIYTQRLLNFIISYQRQNCERG